MRRMLLFPNVEGTRVAGTGHFLMMEKPDEFNRVRTTFLDRIGFGSMAGLS